VDPECEGLRLDRYLSLRIRRLSRARAARLEVIDLDEPGRPLKKSSAVRAGQRLWVRRPVPDAGVEAPEPEVLFEDADLLVLNKPAGLATHPTASRFVATVTHWLSRRDPVPAEPAHRLDVETSGVLICGKHLLANRLLKSAFAERSLVKTYRAVVEGLPVADAFEAEQPLGFAGDSEVRLKMGLGDMPAHTAFEVVRRGRRRALVEARPLTGRQHQIRCHLALAGHWVVGDKLYGPDEGLFLNSLERALSPAEIARLGHHRQALHAWRLSLVFRDTPRVFEAPWPAELDLLVF
jgi:23S rRNA pseudouridine1911/1915/1917 synthase